MNLYFKSFKFLLFSCLFSQILCLYEDQVGKFDWRKSFVGSLKFAKIIDRGGSKRLFVATNENVLASIVLKSGDLKWRHILEKDHQGVVHFLHADEDLITTVTGTSNVLIRGWHPDRGFLNFQWSLPAVTANNLKGVLWWVQNERFYQIVLIADSHIEVTGFNLRSGTKAKPSFTIAATWVSHSSSCAISNGVLLCASEAGVVTALPFLDPEPKARKPFSLLANERCTVESVSVSSLPAFIAIQPLTWKKTLIVLLDEKNHYLKPNIPKESDVSLHSLTSGKHAVVEVTQQGKNLVVSGSVLDGEKSVEQLPALSTSVEVPSIITGASLPASHCIVERDKTISCDLLVNTHDDAIAYFNSRSKKISWLREEALASIVSVQLIDLGVSEEEAAIEKEFNNKESSFFGMFYRRISSQLHQLQSFVYTISGMLDQPSEPGQTANLVRDEFGLHKVIVAVSKVGKLFGIDNLSGNILWTQLVKDVVPFSLADTSLTVPFFVQRTARHFPSPAICTVVFQDAITGNGVLFSFNPITGEPLGDGQRRLPYKIQQTLMLHQKNEDNLNGILLVDDKKRVHPYPESTLKTAIAVAPSTYLFIANPSTGLVTGFSVHYSPKEGLTAQTIWEVNVGKGIISVEAKNPLEKVHSQGRVLSDRSVLYKYINPNLIAVTTFHQDPVHKSVVNLWLIDAVSGAVAYSTSHKRATPPVHVIHSENWVVYSYFNEKFRRTEIGTLELYEGKNQRNTTAFTAAEAALIVPQVGKQAYILPASIEAMRETITEKGITSKHVLVAMSTGGILEIPWPFLDPRRPATVTQEMREEGVIPYIPELPIPSEAIINYNQTLLRLRGIHTTPSGLESTSLVFAYGLDLFYTRISPSKTFDLLKEDFDYFLIMVVLTGLSIAAYATKHLAGRKALKQAWK